MSEKDCQWRWESEINHHDNYEVIKVQFGVLFMQVLNFALVMQYIQHGGKGGSGYETTSGALATRLESNQLSA